MKLLTLIAAKNANIIKFTTIGMTLLLIASLILVCNPMQMYVDTQLSLKTGTLLYNFWQKPPLEVLITVYMFNVTNLEAYLEGTDSKLNMSEVGPYVYQEILENHNIKFNENNTVTYNPRRKVKFIREKSIGDPKVDKIVAPNIPYMGITSDASTFSTFAAIAVRALTRQLNSKAMLHLTVHEYLWGYDDHLVKLASKILPKTINFERFGLMERMFDEGHNLVTMHLPEQGVKRVNKSSHARDYSIDNWNGKTGLHVWDFQEGANNTNCNTLRGTYDGTLFPRRIQQGETFRVYRKAFCRTLPLIYTHPTKYNGIEGYNFELKDTAFDSNLNDPDSACFCKHSQCLKKGLGSIRPCYYNMPLAVSFPHFLHADQTLLTAVNGLNPDKLKHGTEILIQPQLGVPMRVHTRFQVNLLVDNVKFNADVAKFRNTVLPVLWLEIGVDNLTPDLLLLLKLLFTIGPYIQIILVSAFIVMGSAMLGLSILSVLQARSLDATKKVTNAYTSILPLFRQQALPTAAMATKMLLKQQKYKTNGHFGTTTALLPSLLLDSYGHKHGERRPCVV